MIKINTSDYCTFKYQASIDKLGIFYDYGIFYNIEKQILQISNDPLGDSKRHDIYSIDIEKDLTKISFSTMMGSKQKKFSISPSFKPNYILNEFIGTLVKNGFSKSKSDLDNIEILLDKETIKHIMIFKYVNGIMSESFVIINNEQLYFMRPNHPAGQIPVINLEIKDNHIFTYTIEGTFIYKIDSQPIIIDTLKKIIDSTMT